MRMRTKSINHQIPKADGEELDKTFEDVVEEESVETEVSEEEGDEEHDDPAEGLAIAGWAVIGVADDDDDNAGVIITGGGDGDVLSSWHGFDLGGSESEEGSDSESGLHLFFYI